MFGCDSTWARFQARLDAGEAVYAVACGWPKAARLFARSSARWARVALYLESREQRAARREAA